MRRAVLLLVVSLTVVSTGDAVAVGTGSEVAAYRAKVNAICRRSTSLLIAYGNRSAKALRAKHPKERERILREALARVTDLQDAWLAIPVPRAARAEMRSVRANHILIGKVFRKALAQPTFDGLVGALDEADAVGGGHGAVDARTDAAGLADCGSHRTKALNP